MLAGIGVACGLTAALLLSRLLAKLLFEVSPVDPLTYATVGIGLARGRHACELSALRAGQPR